MLPKSILLASLLVVGGCTAKETGSNFLAGLIVASVFVTTSDVVVLRPTNVPKAKDTCLEELVVSVDKQGEIWVGDEITMLVDGHDNIWLEGAIVPDDKLAERIAKIDTCVVLRVSANSSHGKLVFTKDTLDQAGVDNRIEIISGD